MPRKQTRRETIAEERLRHSASESFEERTSATLEAQDRILERVEQKLEAPVLNGGFEDLTRKVDKIENVTELMRESMADTNKKVGDIHTVIYDPEKGIYVTLKGHDNWIERVGKGFKWGGALVVTGVLTGIGKLIYDFITGHIHFTP
jgi:hypothetical protein